MRVDIRETPFPRIRVKSESCDWTDRKIAEREKAFLEATQRWEQLKKEYDSQIELIPRFETKTNVKVQIVEKLIKNCVYEVGEILLVVAEQWEKKWQNLKIGEQINAGFYIGNILEVETVRVQAGNRRMLPDWKLPDSPKKEASPGLHEAVKQCQEMILSVCPHARWDGFWNERPKIFGFLDSKKSETSQTHSGCEVWVEKGTQYIVELCEESQFLILYKQRVEKYFYYYEVTSVGEIGGSWSDKGYY